MKSNIQRIVFYTRKAARYGSQYPRKARRYDRLMAYKAELHRRIQVEKLQALPV